MHKKRGDASIPSVLHLLTTARRSCHFSTRQPTYVFFYFGKEQGILPFTTSKYYTPCGYDSILRFVTAWDQKFYILLQFRPPSGVVYIDHRIDFSITTPCVLSPKTYNLLHLDSIALATTPYLYPRVL